jgi:hypothetical protein
MLHACVERFDVMCVRGNILGWEGEVNEAFVCTSNQTQGPLHVESLALVGSEPNTDRRNNHAWNVNGLHVMDLCPLDSTRWMRMWMCIHRLAAW